MTYASTSQRQKQHWRIITVLAKRLGVSKLSANRVYAALKRDNLLDNVSAKSWPVAEVQRRLANCAELFREDERKMVIAWGKNGTHIKTAPETPLNEPDHEAQLNEPENDQVAIDGLRLAHIRMAATLIHDLGRANAHVLLVLVSTARGGDPAS